MVSLVNVAFTIKQPFQRGSQVTTPRVFSSRICDSAAGLCLHAMCIQCACNRRLTNSRSLMRKGKRRQLKQPCRESLIAVKPRQSLGQILAEIQRMEQAFDKPPAVRRQYEQRALGADPMVSAEPLAEGALFFTCPL